MTNNELRRLFRDRDVPELVARGASGSPQERAQAMQYLGDLRHSEAIPALRNALLDAEAPQVVRQSAARALAAIGGSEALAVLLDCDAQNPGLQVRVAEALGILGDRDGCPRLEAFLESPDSRVRHAAARALRQVRPDAAVPVLQSRLGDTFLVRREARAALKAVGTDEAIAALRANPHRLRPLRAFDARDALRMREQISCAEMSGPRLVPVPQYLVARSLQLALGAAGGASIALLAFSADPVGLGLASVAAVAAYRFGDNPDSDFVAVDRALARTVDASVGRDTRSSHLTFLRVAVTRPHRVVVVTALSFALDLATGFSGIVAGAWLGVALAVAWRGQRTARLFSGTPAARDLLVDVNRPVPLDGPFYR